MPDAPKRIQLRRARGWRLPEGAINCARPGPYGNPFRVDGDWITWAAVALGYRGDKAGRTACAIAVHRAWQTGEPVALGPMSDDRSGPAITFSNGAVLSLGEHSQRIALGATYLFEPPKVPETPPDLAPLRCHDLACWCGPADVCHVDCLLAVANA